MHPKFKNIAIHKSDKETLEWLSKITGISQARLISDFLEALAEWVSAYERATIRFDDSDCRITSSEQVIKIVISGSKRLECGSKTVESGEDKNAIEKNHKN